MGPITKVGTRPASSEAGPLLHKLGTIDCDMVETTPLVFRDRLYRFEYVRQNYHANRTGDSFFRFVDVDTGQTSPGFAPGYHLGSAYVERDTAYVYGVENWGGRRIEVFWSDDLKDWRSQPALTQPGWKMYNTSVCRGPGRYVMAIELGEPPEIVGTAFTMRFAESDDLLHWRLLGEQCVYSKDFYSACPALRFLDGYFYMIYLHAYPGPTYAPHIVRCRDLAHWEPSPLNPVMRFSDEDKQIANPELTAEQREAIARATNINNSDLDLCEFRGRTIIYYSWGNQTGTEFLAQAEFNGSLQSLLGGFFPE